MCGAHGLVSHGDANKGYSGVATELEIQLLTQSSKPARELPAGCLTTSDSPVCFFFETYYLLKD